MMSCNIETLWAGTTARLTATFTDTDGNVGDPDNVSFTVADPDGAETTVTYAPPATDVERVGVGVYRAWVATGEGAPGAYVVTCKGWGDRDLTVVQKTRLVARETI